MFKKFSWRFGALTKNENFWGVLPKKKKKNIYQGFGKDEHPLATNYL